MKKKYIIIMFIFVLVHILLIIRAIIIDYKNDKYGRYTVAYIESSNNNFRGSYYRLTFTFNGVNYIRGSTETLYQHTVGDSVYIKYYHGGIHVIDNVMDICIPGDTIPVNGWKEIPICR